MKLTIVKALISKEVKQIKRDASSVLVAFILPMIVLLIFGYGVSFNIENIKMELVNLDSGTMSNKITDLYASSKYFNINKAATTEDAQERVESGESQGIIIIPEHFSKKFIHGLYGMQTNQRPIRGSLPEIQIISDGTDPNTAAYIEAYASGMFYQYCASLNKTKPQILSVNNRLWFNSTTESINFLMSGALTMILSIVGTFLTALVVAKEWERGTMEALIATPVSIWEIIISKIVPYFVLCIFSLVFSLLYGILVFNVPFQGSILALTLVATVFITVSILIGLIISTTAKDQFVASMGAMVVTFLPTFMLSGFVFEIKSMPLWLQCLTVIFPAKYFVSSIRTLCLVGDVWSIILENTAILSAMAVFLMYSLKKKLRKNIE
ncbi:MAG: ABC transporter permease [Holosporales bacterium]|jgi:ABC-2 type transport system permease protein|nr:ABC transporter permease [Holosporales bacterium]